MRATALAMVLAIALGAQPSWAASSFSLDLFNKGIDAYQHHDNQQAIDAFKQVTDQEDASAQIRAAAYGNRCLIELQQADHEQAIADCTKGINLDSDNLEFYLNRGLAYYRVGDYVAAIADYDHLLDSDPNDYRAFYNRGLAQFALEQYGEAIASYDQSIQLSPDLISVRMADIYDDRGAAYLLLDDYNQAITNFSQAIAYEDSDTRAYFNRGCAHHRARDEIAALEDFHRVLAMSPTHAETYFNLGMLRYDMGYIDGAIASMKQAAYHFYTQGKREGYEKALGVLRQLQQFSTFG